MRPDGARGAAAANLAFARAGLAAPRARIIGVVLAVGLAAGVGLVPAAASEAAADAGPQILVDRIGYLPDTPKIALLIDREAALGNLATVRAVPSGRIVMTVAIQPERRDPWSRHAVADIDFSALDRPGAYRVHVGNLDSDVLTIGADVYDEALRTMMRSYYLQRCGEAIDDPESGLAHAACHLEDGVLARDDAWGRAGDPWPAAGGWHDAGDFGKYVSTTTVTVARLLDVFERSTERFAGIDLGLPVTSPLPDWLAETTVGLRWLLRMQRADGAVYRKLSGRAWPEPGSPDADRQVRLVYGVSTEDTAKLAAVMAYAERVLRPWDAELAGACLRAALDAWRYLESMPGMHIEGDADDNSGSGPYTASQTDTEASLLTDRDDRLWAAAELWLTTGEPRFLDRVAAWAPDAPINLFEWKDPSLMGLVHLLTAPRRRWVGDRIADRLRQRIVAAADALMAIRDGNPFRLANRHFIWGSNKMAAEAGMLLLHAFELTGARRYREAAFDQLHYLFGRNHHDTVFVSGLGDGSVHHVSHLWGRTLEHTVPGLVVGGPNALAQARIAPAGKGPESWIDDVRSYATNESAIDYNASLIGLLGALLAPPRSVTERP